MPQDTVFHPSGRGRVVITNAPPSIPGLYARLIHLSMMRPTTLTKDALLEKACMIYPNATIDPDKVDRFKHVCGYDMGKSDVPAAFIQAMFIGMMSRFISSSFFPISPMGLIQTGQSFDMIQPMRKGLKLDLYCWILDMTRTQKGMVTRFSMQAAVAGDNPTTLAFSQTQEKELVWKGTATYLTRAKTKRPKGKKPPSQETRLPIKQIIEVPENTGRRYASVSRDFNPHHLYTWTARPIGFKQPIAHGIWSMARASASLEKAAGYPKLTGMDGYLKLPIFMPACITLGYAFSETNALFELRDKAKGIPHLKGNFRFSSTVI